MKRHGLWADLALLSAIVCVLVLVCIFTPTQDLDSRKMLLQSWTVWGLYSALVLAVIGFVGLLPKTRAFLDLSGRPRSFFFAAAAVLLVFSALLSLPVRRSIIFWDEHIYMGVAQSIAATGKAAVCQECDAEFGDFFSFQTNYNKEPAGFAFFLSLFYSLLGWSEKIAYFASSVAYLIGVACVGMLGRILFRSRFAGLSSAFMYGATPLVLHWTGTCSAEVASSAFCAAAALSVAVYCRRPALWSMLLMVGLCDWMIQLRAENVLMLIPLALFVLLRARAQLLRTHFLFGALLFSILGSIEFIHLYTVRFEDWGSHTDKFSLLQFWKNFPINGKFLIDNRRFPLIVTLLAAVGIAGKKMAPERMLLGLWFLWSWGIYLFFYAGSYDYGADSRFSIASAAPLALLAGRGIAIFAERSRRYFSDAQGKILFASLAFVGFLPFFQLARAEGFEAVDARLDANFSRELAKQIPPNSVVVSHVPELWLIRGFNAVQAHMLGTQLEHVRNDLFERYRGGVYFHYGYWCNVPDPPENAICDLAFSKFNTELISEKRGRGFRFALYRLQKRTGPDVDPPEQQTKVPFVQEER